MMCRSDQSGTDAERIGTDKKANPFHGFHLLFQASLHFGTDGTDKRVCNYALYKLYICRYKHYTYIYVKIEKDKHKEKIRSIRSDAPGIPGERLKQ